MQRNKLRDWLLDHLGIILLILGLAVIGIGATLGEWFEEPGEWVEVAKTGIVALGTTSGIAGLLALTVDRTLKMDIARDAFRKVMGWATPELLESELRKVYEVHFLAVEHRMEVDLAEMSANGFTKMTFYTERTLKNISLERKKVRPKLSIREWQDPSRKSAVTEISANKPGEVAHTGHGQAQRDDEEAFDLKWSQLTEEFILEKEEKLTVRYRGYEDKLPDDIHSETFTFPTLNPKVIVKYPALFDVYVQFNSGGGTQEPKISSELSNNLISTEWNLKGTMLPNQAITIRWRQKDATPHSE